MHIYTQSLLKEITHGIQADVPLFRKVTNSRREKRFRLIILTSSELQHLRHCRSEIVDALGFASTIQSCDSLKATDLDCKLDVPGLPNFLQDGASTHTLVKCGLALSNRIMTHDNRIPGRLFLIALCGLSRIWVYHWALMEMSSSLNSSNRVPAC
ncbi:hypothetical protein TNCV_4483561 [Trichonephila clavipes]|nr:hypothetical protein TNCV_4483561 [Trichonephila clavipes]